MDIGISWAICGLEGIIYDCTCLCLSPLHSVETLAATTLHGLHHLGASVAETPATEKQLFLDIPVELLKASGTEINAK